MHELNGEPADCTDVSQSESSGSKAWQAQLIDAVRSVEELADILGLNAAEFAGSNQVCNQFPLLVPRAYLEKISPRDLRDPLLLQILPRAEEMAVVNGFCADPVGDLTATAQPGLIRKYAGRALLIASGSCAINCRYCFRRHFPYSQNRLDSNALRKALEYIAADKSISEVILSGGEPLLLRDPLLLQLLGGLDRVGHVVTIRIHTRMLATIPERLTPALLQGFAALGASLVVVFHVNHARELDGRFREMSERLRGAGAHLLNQSVLLARVNDSVQTLEALSRTLFSAGVIPYYLHMLDRVQGAAHFDVPMPRARVLLETLRARLPGYLVPRLVREIPGETAKTPL